MKKHVLFFVALFLTATNVFAQSDTSNSVFRKTAPRHYAVNQALEAESLVPMFFTGGYHFAIGYRYKKFRLRASVINGGHYDAEPAGLKNSSADFKRYYKTSPGFFLGYNVWKNLELYSFVEMHTFRIGQKNTGMHQDIRSNDFGGGISYQFFVGRYFYIQPGMHLYLRAGKTADFDGVKYNIPHADISPVLRLGFRLWEKF
ncbi:MAG: hypothetical protein H7Z13_15110 [Ferruginibacter sp.]|nr:hypothetical protein [Ferruginibacter sp.]